MTIIEDENARRDRIADRIGCGILLALVAVPMIVGVGFGLYGMLTERSSAIPTAAPVHASANGTAPLVVGGVQLPPLPRGAVTPCPTTTTTSTAPTTTQPNTLPPFNPNMFGGAC